MSTVTNSELSLILKRRRNEVQLSKHRKTISYQRDLSASEFSYKNRSVKMETEDNMKLHIMKSFSRILRTSDTTSSQEYKQEVRDNASTMSLLSRKVSGVDIGNLPEIAAPSHCRNLRSISKTHLGLGGEGFSREGIESKTKTNVKRGRMLSVSRCKAASKPKKFSIIVTGPEEFENGRDILYFSQTCLNLQLQHTLFGLL